MKRYLRIKGTYNFKIGSYAGTKLLNHCLEDYVLDKTFGYTADGSGIPVPLEFILHHSKFTKRYKDG